MPQPEPDARKGYCMWEEREGRAVYAPLEWRAEAVREELGYMRALPDDGDGELWPVSNGET